MDATGQLNLTPSKNNDTGHDSDAAAVNIPSPKIMDSPKTPVRSFDDSMDDYDTDDIESPQFPHLIPIHQRMPNEYDIDVRIGWDDGFGISPDDSHFERSPRRLRRNGFISERRRGSLFGRRRCGNNCSKSIDLSPNTIDRNNAIVQKELNDYLGCVLRCLSAKKRERQLQKLQNEAKSANNSENNSVVKNLLNDSSDDELLFLCSQAIEKTMDTNSTSTAGSSTDSNCSAPTSLIKGYNLSIVGISPLENTNDTINNNVQAAKRFKSIQCNQLFEKTNVNSRSQCDGKNTENNENSSSALNINTKNNKDSSLLLNSYLDNEDDLFSSIDLSEIDNQILSGAKETTHVKQKFNQLINTNKLKNVTSTFPSSTSSNNKQFYSQQKISSGVNGTINSGITGDIPKKYCTPAEIEAKRECAQRKLMLKFKSRNKSAI